MDLHLPSGPGDRLEHDDGDPTPGEVAVLVVARIEARELLPDGVVLGGCRWAGGDSVVSAIDEDVRAAVGLQVEPPRGDAVAAGVGRDDSEGVAVADEAERCGSLLATLA